MNQGGESVAEPVNSAAQMEKLQELTEMVDGTAYKETYLRGILLLKILVEEYEAECIFKWGKSPIKLVDYRLKSAESIAEKLEKKRYPISCESAKLHLNDLAGIRVVCDLVEDVYRLQSYIAGRDEIRILKVKDYIKLPKENGYQSLHLIIEVESVFLREETIKDADIPEKICVEMQIRTEEMHGWAQRDHELYYKNG